MQKDFKEVPIDQEIRQHTVDHQEEKIVILYRRYTTIPDMTTSNWWFTPKTAMIWRPVKSKAIRKLLDANKHPRE